MSASQGYACGLADVPAQETAIEPVTVIESLDAMPTLEQVRDLLTTWRVEDDVWHNAFLKSKYM